MNEYKFTEEDNNAFLNANEVYEQEISKSKELSSDDFKKLDRDIQIKLAHMELKDRQSIELINLQNRNASLIEEENLRQLHKDEEERFFKQQYSVSDMSGEQHIKKIQAKHYISPKEFAEIFGLSNKQQYNYRNRITDPLPYYQLTEDGNISYNIEEVKEWRKRQDEKLKKKLRK